MMVEVREEERCGATGRDRAMVAISAVAVAVAVHGASRGWSRSGMGQHRHGHDGDGDGDGDDSDRVTRGEEGGERVIPEIEGFVRDEIWLQRATKARSRPKIKIRVVWSRCRRDCGLVW